MTTRPSPRIPFFSDRLSDDLRLPPKRTYLVSPVHYSSIYGKSPVGSVRVLQCGFTPEQTRIFGRIARDSVFEYPFTGVKQ